MSARPERSNQMGNQSDTNSSTELLFLTDQHGNAYVVPSETVAHARITKEHEAQVKEIITADTIGYGDTYWMQKGILSHMGWVYKDPTYTKDWDAGNVGNFDLNGDGQIDKA